MKVGVEGDANESDRKIRILIADDHPVVRKMVRFTLEQVPRFEVCGEAQDGAEAIKEARKLRPDVIVLNLNMPVLNGFAAAREIKTTIPESAIIILSSEVDHRLIDEAKKIGVRAYVSKTKTGDELVKAIEAAVTHGDFVLLK